MRTCLDLHGLRRPPTYINFSSSLLGVMDDQRRFVTVEEAAAVLGIKPRTLRDQMRRGEIAGAVKIGRIWRVSRSWLDGLEQPDSRST